MVNITDMRSDAIIVTTSGVESIALPGLTLSETVAWIQQGLTEYKKDENSQVRGKKNPPYREFLQWLWSTCVRTIVEIIYHNQMPTLDNLPRIWWIGVGTASSLPFHAAGDHSIGSTENMFSWAISSYTPTIKARAHARGRPSKTSEDRKAKPQLLVVAMMPTTPEEPDLENVKKEISVVPASDKVDLFQ